MTSTWWLVGKCVAYLGLRVWPKEDSFKAFHDYQCHGVVQCDRWALGVIQSAGW